MKYTLHTRAFDGGPFNNSPARDLELNAEDILANDVTFAHEYNPNRVRLWVIGHEFGALVAVWANSESDAFDTMVDEDKGLPFLIEPEDLEDYRVGEVTYLGNASEPHDLEHAWIQEVELNPSRDSVLMLAFAEARGAGADTLDDI